MTIHDSVSFSAGQDAGARTSACVARLAAIRLVEESRWWNRWRRRLMARALLACADELEDDADARRAEVAEGPSPEAPVDEAPVDEAPRAAAR